MRISTIKEIVIRYCSILKEAISVDLKLFCKKLVAVVVNAMMTYTGLLLPKYMLQTLRRGEEIGFISSLVIVVVVNFCLVFVLYKLLPSISADNEKYNAFFLERFLKKSLSLPLEYFEKRGSYDNYTLVFNQIVNLFQYSIEFFVQGLSAFLQVIVVIYFLSWMHPMVICILITFSIMKTVINYKNKKVTYFLKKQVARQTKKLNYLYRLFYIVNVNEKVSHALMNF